MKFLAWRMSMSCLLSVWNFCRMSEAFPPSIRMSSSPISGNKY
jgi:hypothetical protein